MMLEDEALSRILDRIVPASPVVALLAAAESRFAREKVVAEIPLPPFDNSAMDGYAITEADCGQTDRWLVVAGEQPAGQPSLASVSPGQATRIFTGAPIPAGTAAVVMQEDVESSADGRTIRVTSAAVVGEFIRRCGADLCAGQTLVEPGDCLSPQKIALLASQGRKEIAVGTAPRVVVLSTGDEVVEAGESLPHSASIYNSNGPMIESLARKAGCVDVARAHSRDQLDGVTQAVQRALNSCDVLIIAGGVSVGARDLVKPALTSAGCELSLWRVLVKPGKPFLFSTLGPKLIFGLPGNPVSAFVTFCLFVAPALRRWQGARPGNSRPAPVWVKLGQPLDNPADRPHYLRGTIDSTGQFFLAGLQESHALYALSRATALVRLDPQTSLTKGEFASALLI
jgi:molybdopterin molybdotransferase